MPRLKWGKNTNFKELNDADYEPSERNQREPYEGPTPKSGTVLEGTIDGLWVTDFPSGQGFKVVFIAEGNKGEKSKYNGCAIWENLPLTPQQKWKWQPFLDMLGVTLKDVYNKVIVDDEESDFGERIKQIARVKIPCPGKVVVKREKYEGEFQARAGDWLMPNPADEDDYEDEEEDERPF